MFVVTFCRVKRKTEEKIVHKHSKLQDNKQKNNPLTNDRQKIRFKKKKKMGKFGKFEIGEVKIKNLF